MSRTSSSYDGLDSTSEAVGGLEMHCLTVKRLKTADA